VDVDEVIANRRMTRRFSTEPVENGLLESILDTARYAPRAGRTSGVELLVLREAARREAFWLACSSATWRAQAGEAPGLLAAPVIVVPVADPDAYAERYREKEKAGSSLHGLPPGDWPVPYWSIDSAFAVMLLLLAAENRGLGALFFQLQGREAEVAARLGIPEGRELIGALALGHRADAADRARRRPARQATHYEHFGASTHDKERP
jgi:nitroreductase